jgi:hypothetical protein
MILKDNNLNTSTPIPKAIAEPNKPINPASYRL